MTKKDEWKKEDIKDRQVYVNDDCIWCWACVAICPDWFDLDDEWKAYAIDGCEKSEDLDSAIWVCPVSAINYKN